MQVFKFGGASVKDAEGVKNVLNVLQKVGYSNTVVVISAMGKTTNALEHILKLYFDKASHLQLAIQDLKTFHTTILEGLFNNTKHPIYDRINVLFNELEALLKTNKSPNYNFVYDQVISFGELLSTTIVSYYLNDSGITNTWVDARELIKTDNYYRTANVNWQLTQEGIVAAIDTKTLTITQGFIGSDANNFTTTLGREGSDYTAAIFGYSLNAKSVTIWKDVPGVLNADPRYFNETQLLHHISYTEAIELAFYGASVIHPKTLQPIQQKEIPLYVKSFLHPENEGTKVSKGVGIEPHVPCFIVKKNQVLISLSTLDFSFIVEKNISHIFNLLHQYKMKVDVIQNSAISFSVCFEDKYDNLDKLLHHLRAKFKVSCKNKVSLYTVRHYNAQAISSLEQGKTILLKQLLQDTVQVVAM